VFSRGLHLKEFVEGVFLSLAPLRLAEKPIPLIEPNFHPNLESMHEMQSGARPQSLFAQSLWGGPSIASLLLVFLHLRRQSSGTT
jgi:hypothetical protein